MRKVLIIDDEEELCEMVRDCLTQDGRYEVVTATDPRTVLELCRQERPDMILLDIVMPELKGTALIEAIRSDESLKGMILIVTSGLGEMVYHKKKDKWTWEPNRKLVHERGEVIEEKTAEKAAQAYGVDDYLAKPFTQDLLLRVVEENFDKFERSSGSEDEDF